MHEAELARLHRLTAIAPRDAELRLQLARKLICASRKEEAIAEIKAAIALAPNHLEARKLLQSARSM